VVEEDRGARAKPAVVLTRSDGGRWHVSMTRSSDVMVDDGTSSSQWSGSHRRGRGAARCRGEAFGGDKGEVVWSNVAAHGEVLTAEEEARHGVAVMAPGLATRLTDATRRRLGARRQLLAGSAAAAVASGVGACGGAERARAWSRKRRKQTFACRRRHAGDKALKQWATHMGARPVRTGVRSGGDCARRATDQYGWHALSIAWPGQPFKSALGHTVAVGRAQFHGLNILFQYFYYYKLEKYKNSTSFSPKFFQTLPSGR
jgi:hypothetical protein